LTDLSRPTTSLKAPVWACLSAVPSWNVAEVEFGWILNGEKAPPFTSAALNKVVTGSQSDTISIFGDTLTDPQNITILVAEDTDSNFKLIEP
jgi:hypothetical protein